MRSGGPLIRFLIPIFIIFTGIIGHAQYEGDDVYDPFADYSEFEENTQEEADINFFRNGRFFNVAILLGGRMFTQGMADNAEAAASPGLALTYWFNLRLALQFSYTYSQHLLGPIAGGLDALSNPITVQGNMSVNMLAFDMKYYFNTNNVTRGLADLNPYVLIGFSQSTRNFSLVDQVQVAKDDGAGLDIGGGIEIPINRNEMFIGFQAVYTYVNFATENSPVVRQPLAPETVFLDGDMFNFHIVVGFNFL
jgi:hypothetical protein